MTKMIVFSWKEIKLNNIKFKEFVLSHSLRSFISRNAFAFAWIAFFTISLVVSFSRATMPFISQWDELYHLSYLQYVSQGVIPAFGFPMNDWAKTAFSCYPVSLLGISTDVPCGELGAGARYPTGGTNTAAIWPPVYYILAALFMAPIKFLFGVSDNLFAARFATSIIWAAGTSLLSLFVFKKSRSFLLGLTFALLTTSLSLFGQSASFVSPHSTVPLLLFGGVTLAFWLDRNLRVTQQGDFWELGKWRNSVGQFFLWLAVVFLFGLALSLTVPHAFPLLLIVGIYVFAGAFGKPIGSTLGITRRLAITFALLGFSGIGFLIARNFWVWQSSARSTAFPEDVNLAAADVDAPATYPDIFQQIFTLWWDFWPQGLQNPWLQGSAAVFVENFWIFIL